MPLPLVVPLPSGAAVGSPCDARDGLLFPVPFMGDLLTRADNSSERRDADVNLRPERN